MTDGLCPQCGAPVGGEKTCQEVLHDLLDRTYAGGADELADAYGLAIACYALQHPAGLPDEA
ncbi:MAG: DUF5946 family protein, partial [Chloroflexota bacterium]